MKLLLIALLTVILVSSTVLSVRAGDFNTVGDIGCKSAALANLKNLAGQPKSFFGVGDIAYKCSTSTLLKPWNAVNSKRTTLGNHECEKGQGTVFVQQTFGAYCNKGYKAYIRGGNVAVILLNQYTSYKVGSNQYKFVKEATEAYDNMSEIVRIVYVFHEPIYPVPCSSSHCHGLEKPSFKSTYEPLIKEHHVLVIQAHTHLISFGTINGVPSAICGGGGEDGTSLNGNGGYTYVSNKMSYCKFHIEASKIVVQQIDTTGKIIHTHTWNTTS